MYKREKEKIIDRPRRNGHLQLLLRSKTVELYLHFPHMPSWNRAYIFKHRKNFALRRNGKKEEIMNTKASILQRSVSQVACLLVCDAV